MDLNTDNREQMPNIGIALNLHCILIPNIGIALIVALNIALNVAKRKSSASNNGKDKSEVTVLIMKQLELCMWTCIP